MNKKLGRIILSFSTVLLMGGTLYVGTLLIQPPGNSVTTVKKTKAASFTYTRYLAYNTSASNEVETPTPLLSPTEGIGSTGEPTVTPIAEVTVTGVEGEDVTPTEIILANNYTTPSVNPSVKPTDIPKVPESGWTQYSLVIFAGASLLVFFAFLF